MKILHFVNAYFPSTGGTVTRIHNLFHNDDNEHTFIIPLGKRAIRGLPGGRPPDDEQVDNLRIRRVIVPSPQGIRRFLPAFYREQAKRLVERAAGEAPDILYGHNPLTCAIASQGFHVQNPKVPFIYEAHGIMRDFSNVGPGHPLSAIRDNLTRRMLGRFERRVFSQIDTAVAQTHAAKRRIAELYHLNDDQIEVIHNGVDLDRFSPDKWCDTRQTIRRDRQWKEKTIVFYAGYLDEVNGIAALLNAACALPAESAKRIKIVIAGKGPREKDVIRAAETHPDRVEFLGSLPHDAMPGYYAATDVFVIPRPPYRPAETLLPMKLLEAMAMEKLVLVSSVAGMTDVVCDGQNGLVFPKDKPGELRERLMACVRHDPSDASLGQRARETVMSRFSWRESRRQLASLYRRCADATR